MKDTRAIIADFVGVAGSLEEAKELVNGMIAKGGCAPIPEHLRDEMIESLWDQKVKASALVDENN